MHPVLYQVHKTLTVLQVPGADMSANITDCVRPVGH